MKRIVVGLLCAIQLRAAEPEVDIRRVLHEQAAAWNAGDVRTYMNGYADSPSTTFVGSTITKGHAQVLARYLSRYPTKEAMGTLTFSDLEIQTLGSEYASVLGRWHLTRPKDAGGDVGGIFTLLFRKTTQGWKIILDHTS
jgi:ketosteroid isomerase-like protein